MKKDERKIFEARITSVKKSKWVDNTFYITADTAFGEIRYVSKKPHKEGDITHVRQQKNKIAWDPIKWEEC